LSAVTKDATMVQPTRAEDAPDAALVTLTAPGSFEAEQYQGLRLTVERLHRARDVRVIAVTSACIGDGKSVTSINLATTLAQGSGTQVLLIDADLRRPSVGAYLGLDHEGGMGLAEAVGDAGVGLKPAVRQVRPGSNLSVVLAGTHPTSVPELLRSPAFESLLQEARGQFDYVIIDTPPLAPVWDAAVMSRIVDGMIIVVSAHQTPRKLLEQALNVVDESKVLGIVFNRDDTFKSKQYDAYYRR
jgi:capsular exopolysaccharide synthesis family protein